MAGLKGCGGDEACLYYKAVTGIPRPPGMCAHPALEDWCYENLDIAEVPNRQGVALLMPIVDCRKNGGFCERRAKHWTPRPKFTPRAAWQK